MFGIYDLIIIFIKFALEPKAPSPIVVTVSGMRIEVRLVQPLNAYSPMVVSEAENIIEVKLLQPRNAL